MPLAPCDLSTLSRLLDEALDLEPAQIEAWLAALPEEHAHLQPRLREMLAEHGSPGHPSFMADGPRLADGDLPADESAPRSGDLIGPYRLIREIGHGGMSTVWLGERPDGVVKRAVAIKVPLLTLKSSTQIERFERERDVLAMLNHPQIARLYDAGVEPSGRPYIVLEHVQGLPIAEACDALRMDLPARLRTFLQVLAAVDHAHKHLVVHRDIKPSNVFVDAEGQVKLLDFGIAKLLSAPTEAMDATRLTREGGRALTPRYAAPEQLDGRPISTATDVYSLGVLLYELMTGGLPHAGAQGSMAEAVNAALHTVPLAPSLAPIDGEVAVRRALPNAPRLRALLAGDLDTIVLKALRTEPPDRYSSVERFADDIQCFLARRPIAARAPSTLHRLRLFLQRHRNAAAAGAIGCAAAIVLAVLLGQQYLHTAAQEARANAVREFMMDMVEDAEPDDTHPDGEVTGKQMVEGALRRAHDRFGDQPQLLGDVLSELGRMFRNFGDAEKSRAVLIEADALLRAHATADDPALNKNHVWMAHMAVADGDLARARELGLQARNGCRRQDAECAKARAYASSLLADIDVLDGNLQRGLAEMRVAVAETERAFGPRHAESAVVWHNLALTARNAGEPQEAERAIEKALAIAGHTVLRTKDRLRVEQTQAVIELDLGRFAAARDRLRSLVERTIGGSERAERLRLQANAELALGEADSALASAEQALALAVPGQAGSEALFAHQAHARAVSLLGRAEAALAEMRAAMQGLQAAGFAAGSAPLVRAHRIIGEMLARNGDFDAAWQETEPVVAALAAEPGKLVTELGQLLDLQGCIQRDLGRPTEAAKLHERARTVLASKLPADHPFLARNALYRERALAIATGSSQATQRYDQLAAAYGQRFGAASSWRRVIAAQQDLAACAATPTRGCTLIL